MIRMLILRWLFKKETLVTKDVRYLLFEILTDNPDLVFVNRFVKSGDYINGQLIVGKGEKPWETGVVVQYSPAVGVTDQDFVHLISLIVKSRVNIH